MTVLSGEMVGALWVARRFPVRIGRAAASDLRLEADGVWDQHLVLDLGREGFSLRVQPNALARVNGQPVAESRLRNGDTIELGGVRLQFWLSPVRQRSLWLQEALSWGAILAVSLGQIGLLYWIIR